MNETIQIIKNRRSTRVFLGEQIKDSELNEIIEAGLFAPSAHNQQSWHFAVVQNKAIMDRLNAEAKNIAKNSTDKILSNMGNNEQFNIFYNAPTVVIVSGDEKSLMPGTDCAAATQNMLIAAESIGIGACWVGMVGMAFSGENGKNFIEELGIPAGVKPYYAVALGYKKNNTTNAPQRKANAVSYIR